MMEMTVTMRAPAGEQHHGQSLQATPSILQHESSSPGSQSRRSGPGTPRGFNPSPETSISSQPYSSYDNSTAGSPIIHRDNGLPGTPTQHHSSQLAGSGPKRAYRQRRKDPSCDACRERKVKCDATESSSCSECSSRSVKCQFTKETNRRMSSIKQVQDLEKQLAMARAQLQQLKSMTKDVPECHENSLNVPELGANPPKRYAPAADPSLSNIRSHIRNYSSGVFKPPPPYRQAGTQKHFSPPLPDLPPRHIAEDLLGKFNNTVHNTMPILHWPRFYETYEGVYRDGNFTKVSPSWASTFFAVLACGLLFTVDPQMKESYPDGGRHFIEESRKLTDLFNDEFTVDHCRAALLTVLFLTEMNCTSAAWAWMGSTVRIALDIGLHRESGPWPVVEGEMRRRVWWGIYVWDRILSIELGRPLFVNDSDCDVGLPCPVDDHYIFDRGFMVPSDSPPPSNFLLTTIHVVRLITPLMKTLQSPVLSPQTLATFDNHFSACLNTFPVPCQINHPQPLDARALTPIFYLQNARIVLHRHNLSSMCTVEVRAAAVTACVNVAKDSVRYLSRAMLPQSHSWPLGLASSATTMICLHIWRSILFLCYRGFWNEALVCVKACQAIGDTREINNCCGRSIFAFLRQLGDKLARGEAIESDEGMLALVSGDVQGSTESSWVWVGSETGAALDSSANPDIDPALLKEESVASTVHLHARHNPGKLSDWSGWSNVEWMVQQLMNEQAARDLQSFGAGAVHHSSPNLQSPGQQGASRISIANII